MLTIIPMGSYKTAPADISVKSAIGYTEAIINWPSEARATLLAINGELSTNDLTWRLKIIQQAALPAASND